MPIKLVGYPEENHKKTKNINLEVYKNLSTLAFCLKL